MQVVDLPADGAGADAAAQGAKWAKIGLARQALSHYSPQCDWTRTVLLMREDEDVAAHLRSNCFQALAIEQVPHEHRVNPNTAVWAHSVPALRHCWCRVRAERADRAARNRGAAADQCLSPATPARRFLRSARDGALCDVAPVVALRRLNYPWATSHTVRKTVARRLDDAGLPIRQIADQLGHARPSLTLDTYLGRRTIVTVDVAALLDRPSPTADHAPCARVVCGS